MNIAVMMTILTMMIFDIYTNVAVVNTVMTIIPSIE